MVYLMGDVQGCSTALDRLLGQIGFSPSRDRLVVLGDLVNRGPGSLQVLQTLSAFGDAVTSLLGNHDLHLLAVAQGVRRLHRGDTVQDILDDPRREQWLEWLAHRHMACRVEGWLCVHAGVLPSWDADTTLALADEVEAVLRDPAARADFLPRMYGNQPAAWDDALQGAERLRVIVNALTRLRFCTPQGVMDFDGKNGLEDAPPGHHAWFDVPGRLSAGQPIAFGHWSTIGLLSRPDLLAADTGCVWGGALTVVRVDGGRREVHQVRCEAAQQPGD